MLKSFAPIPRGFSLPSRVTVPYFTALAAAVIAAAALRGRITAAGVMGMGMCGYILLDVSTELKQKQPASKRRRTHATATLFITAAALASCAALLFLSL